MTFLKVGITFQHSVSVSFQALSKKESKGGMDSPLGDDSDHEGDFNLTPRTEAKYNKIDEEFHLMMQRNQPNGVRVSSSLVNLSHGKLTQCNVIN